MPEVRAASRGLTAGLLVASVVFAGGCRKEPRPASPAEQRQGTPASATVQSTPAASAQKQQSVGRTTVTISGQTWSVRIAATDQQRRRGLSGVARLEPREGMLFVYETPAHDSFWMAGCVIPLDIAFVGPDLRIISIHTMLVEPSGRPTSEYTLYPPGAPASYALEVGAGRLSEAGVKVGAPVSFGQNLGEATTKASLGQ